MKRYLTLLGFVVFALLVTAGICFAAEAPPPPPASHAYITLAILAVAGVLFFTELVPLPITAMLVPVALSLFNIIPAKAAFANFGNEWVVIFMAMFVVGEATFVTGFADKVGQLTVKLSGGSEVKLLLFSMIAIAGLSAFLSNTGTTVVAIPMIMGMCASAGIRASKILMPVAFAAGLGGCITLVGTPPNGLVNSVLSKMGDGGFKPFGFFEFALFGVPLTIVGILYFALIGKKFLPNTDCGKLEDDERLEVQVPKVKRENKMWICLGIFAFVVAVMASEFIDLVTAAMLGACLMVITGCMTMKEAFKSIDWTTIFLFAGTLALSTALDKSGAAKLIATAVVSQVSDPYMLMAVVCALTAIVTNFMSNTATAALMAPLAVPIATQGGVSPLPLLMGIAMSASACFLTPIATPPNTIVLGPGNYRFMDYFKAGWPLQVISFIMCVTIIPLIWPFK
ncbi:SLC13 family permease [Megalodesulfovibrio paquesii]